MRGAVRQGRRELPQFRGQLGDGSAAAVIVVAVDGHHLGRDRDHQVPGRVPAARSEPLVDLSAGAAGQRLPRVVPRAWTGVHRAGMLARPRAVRAARAAAFAIRPGTPRRDRPQALFQIAVGVLAYPLSADAGFRLRLIVVAVAGGLAGAVEAGRQWTSPAARRSGRHSEGTGRRPR